MICISDWKKDSSGVVWRRVGSQLETIIPSKVYVDWSSGKTRKIPVFHDFELSEIAQLENIPFMPHVMPFDKDAMFVTARVKDWLPLEDVQIDRVIEMIRNKDDLAFYLTSTSRSEREIAKAIAETYHDEI